MRAEITAEQVREAIDRGVDYLKQPAARRWLLARMARPARRRHGAVYAGPVERGRRARRRPRSSRRSSYLRKLKPETDLRRRRCKRWSSAGPSPNEDLLLIRRNVEVAREARRSPTGRDKGGWSYPGGGGGDNSNSQFALLALHEAERAGVHGQRRRPGDWPRPTGKTARTPTAPGATTSGMPGTGSMTCAGIASLVIAADRVRPGRRPGRRRPDRVLPAEARPTTTASSAGLQWLGGNFSVTQQSRRRRASSGCSTISTAWNASAG